MSQAYHLAQINVGRLKAPLGAPEVAEFEAALDPVNAIADSSPGFVWRLKGEFDGATDIHAFDDPQIVTNMSVWADLASLGAYVYRSGHRQVLARRREWFEVPTEAFMALWWIPAGHIPSVQEGVERLTHLRRHGPGAFAFTFKQPFPPTVDTGAVPPVLDECA